MRPPWFSCVSCGSERALGEIYRCPDCGGELFVQYDYPAIRHAGTLTSSWRQDGSMWRRFSVLLPQQDESCIVTLGEGSTPLVRSPKLAARFGVKDVYFKLESCNPTGSFKDRQVSVALSKAREWGREHFGTASSGNVGVALSAYAARAGVRAFVWVSVSTAAAKRQQIQVYGAQLFLTPETTTENMADYFALYTGMQAFCAARGMVPMVSARPVNPYMVEGAKTVVFEIVAALGRAPDRLFAPVGGGGLLGGNWKGFRELVAVGAADAIPALEGTQMDKGHVPVDRLDDPAYLSPNYYRPLDGRWAWEAIRTTGGRLRLAKLAEVRKAQTDLALWEGIFAEPQGATAYAGLLQAWQEGALRSSDLVVCQITGMGLKDMDSAREICAGPEYPALQRVESLEMSIPFL